MTTQDTGDTPDIHRPLDFSAGLALGATIARLEQRINAFSAGLDEIRRDLGRIGDIDEDAREALSKGEENAKRLDGLDTAMEGLRQAINSLATTMPVAQPVVPHSAVPNGGPPLHPMVAQPNPGQAAAAVPRPRRQVNARSGV